MAVFVPTVERGFDEDSCCFKLIAGETPVIYATLGFSMPCIPIASRYCRCDSLKRISCARVDLPDPETPVITLKLRFGIFTLTSFKLCSFACAILIHSVINTSSFYLTFHYTYGNYTYENLNIQEIFGN